MGSSRWVELVDGTPEPGAHAIVRDGLLVRWVNTGRGNSNRWSSISADQMDAIGRNESAPVLLPWDRLVDRGPLQLSLQAGGDIVNGETIGRAVDPADTRQLAAQLAVASSREACRDISGAAAVGAELVDLATVWESWLNGTFEDRGDVVFIGDEELERFRAWEANQRTPEATDPDRPYTVADMEADGDDV
jgi:hypothetical protein